MHWSEVLDNRLSELPSPDLGDDAVWRWWFARSMSGLEDRGWFELLPSDPTIDASPADQTLLVLRWLAEDYCAEIDSDADYEPWWEDWFDALGFPNVEIRTAATRDPEWARIVEDAAFESDYIEDLDILAQAPTDEEEAENRRMFQKELATQSILWVAERQRRAIFKHLAAAWGGMPRLAQSLYAAVHSGGMPPDGEDDGWDDDHDHDHDEDGQYADAPASLLSRVQGRAINELADSAFDLDSTVSSFGETLRGWEWVSSGCPVVTQGAPAYLG